MPALPLTWMSQFSALGFPSLIFKINSLDETAAFEHLEPWVCGACWGHNDWPVALTGVLGAEQGC